MADNNTVASHRHCPPKKRLRVDSDNEELSTGKDSEPVDAEDQEDDDDDDDDDVSHVRPLSTHRNSPSTSKDHYHRLLSTVDGINHEPMIPLCEQIDILALAAAYNPSTIGRMLQQRYDESYARLQRNRRIIDFGSYYDVVSRFFHDLPRNMDPVTRRTKMREACATIDQVFDSIHRRVDKDSKLESKASAARTMQKCLHLLLRFSDEYGCTIPEEYCWDGQQGRLGLDGKMFMLIQGKFDQKKHDIKMMMVMEDPMGGSDWVEKVEELVTLSSRCGEVFKMLPQVLEVVEKDAYDPATDYDSCGAPTF